MQQKKGKKQRMTAEQIGLKTLWSLVQGGPLALFAVDPDGLIIVWNRAAEKMFLWEEYEVIGKINPIIPTGQEEVFQQLRNRALSGEIYTGMEISVLRKEGSIIDVSISTAPLRSDDGAIVGVIAVLKDISQSKRMENELCESLHKSQRLFEETIEALSTAVEVRDPYTAGHQRRVARLACAIASEMGLPEDQVKSINVAALIHDIGKISIPVEILSKPGQLSEIEHELLRTHAQAGYEILKGIEFPWPIAQIVRQHHERIDGCGYPMGLKCDKICLEAKILSVADTVEATASYRPYRPAGGIEKALEVIKIRKGTYYDPEVVAACLVVFKRGFSLD